MRTLQITSRAWIKVCLTLLLMTDAILNCNAQTSMVGSLGGEVTVTPMGTSSYTIPIEVVPGTCGIQPSLSVAYSSSLSRGSLGVGWSLSGLSSISRIPKSQYFDQMIGTVGYDGEDRYALDGERLIKLSNGNYAAEDAVYGTEQENFTRVMLKGKPDTPTHCFEAVTNNGTVIEYGSTAASRQLMSQGGVLSWLVDRITDPEGNYMTFEYSQQSNSDELLPTAIRYTGNTAAGLQTYASVLFDYTTDPNPNAFYVGCQWMSTSKILSGIRVLYGSELVRRYSFEYDYDRSTRLTAVVLKDANGVELTRTTVSWGVDNNATSCLTMNGLQNWNLRIGDFNGDHIADLFLFSHPNGTSSTAWQVRKGDGFGGFVTTHSGTILGDCNDFLSIDMDGKGTDEIAFVDYDEIEENYRFRVMSFPKNNVITTTIGTNETNTILAADFIGNGTMQLIYVKEPQSGNIVIANSFNSQELTVNENAHLSVTDLNGNGKADLQVVYGSSLDVYEYNEQLCQFSSIPNSHYVQHNPNWDYFLDINNDGCLDCIYYFNGYWYLKLSKGNDYWIPQLLPFNGDYINSNTPCFPITVGDLNGDGCEDVVQLTESSNGGITETRAIVYYSKGYSSGSWVYDTVHVLNSNIQCSNDLLIDDLNGDGKNELVITGAESFTPVIINLPERREHDLVVSMTDGYGKATNIDYCYYNSPWTGYVGQDGKKLHNALVSRLTQPDGIGDWDTTVFYFSNAVYDFDRRQTLGFGLSGTYRKGTNVWQQYLYNDTLHHLSLEHCISFYQTRSGSQLTGGIVTDSSFWYPGRPYKYHYETLNTLAYRQLPFGRFIHYHSVSSNVNKLTNAKKTTSVWLNAEGRPEKTMTVAFKEKQENGVSVWTSRDSTLFSYDSIVLPNGKTSVRVTNARTWNKRYGYTQEPYRNIAYCYSGGRIQNVTESDSNGGIGVTSYTYNGFGQPLTVTHTPYDMTARTVTYTYDSKGRFQTSETDPLGHTSSVVHQPTTGLVASKTDIDGLTTSFSYDALGRVCTEIRPDGTVRNVSFHWYTGSLLDNTVWYVTVTEAGTPETRSYYDILGREVHRFRDGSGYDDIVYDSLGRVIATTCMPYGSINNDINQKVWRERTYDKYGRVVTETAPYTSLSYSYYNYQSNELNDYFVTENDLLRGTSRRKTYDAEGRIVCSEDNEVEVFYEYGYLTRSGLILDSLTIRVDLDTTTVLSDLRGNRLSLKDPDAGTTTSAYNALGQLVTKTDANGNQTAFTYDLAGRVTQTVFSKGTDTETVTNVYDNATGNGVGKLAQVLHDGTPERIYTYDTLGRLTNLRVVSDDAYDHRYVYDSLGRVRYIAYPDDFIVRHSYNTFGELAEIRDGISDSLIYAVDQRNAMRRPLQCRFGNGTGTMYTYNDYGMLTHITNGNLMNAGNIINGGDPGSLRDGNISIGSQYRRLIYSYNNRGLIVSRSDQNVNQSESYTYDDLDRLVSYSVNGITTATYSYNRMGNITANSKVGNYSYDSPKPHAVTGISTSLTDAIPQTQCDVVYDLRNKPVSIIENGYDIRIGYYADGTRRNTDIVNGASPVLTKLRVSDLYEVDETPSGYRLLDYVFAEGKVVAIHVTENSVATNYYVLDDHLGSWNKVMGQDKSIVQETHFDPWGNRMSYKSWDEPQTTTFFPFDRGFTGHEHYDCVHIINANARLYDPVIGRFFSPDPFVQAPDFSQSFNRYSYCMNNPVMYSDPTGEIFGTILGFFSDVIDNLFVRTPNNEKWDWTQTQNGWEIDKSLFYTDPNKSTIGRVWEVISRLTWQLPQTLVGDLFVSGANAFEKVKGITHGYGITAVDIGSKIGAVTIGYYTAGPEGYKADWRDHLFVHEYGHYVQSQQHGPLYLLTVAVPSLQSAILWTNNPNSPSHNIRWFEADANYKAADYFDKYYGRGKAEYIEGSPDFFDKYSFSNLGDSPYMNPRKPYFNTKQFPVAGVFHWTDIPISIPILGLFISLLYLKK